ncbi:hypothetical protein GGI35DRAFT_187907 [Trichoderma velutinum]
MSSSGQANQPTMDNDSAQPAITEEEQRIRWEENYRLAHAAMQAHIAMKTLAEDLSNFQRKEELKFRIMPRWREQERLMQVLLFKCQRGEIQPRQIGEEMSRHFRRS